MVISAVLVLFVILLVLLRSGFLRAGSAIVAVLFGFFLASTGLAPAVTHALDSIASALNTIGH